MKNSVLKKNKRGRPRVHEQRFDGNFWRQKKHLEQKYVDGIKIQTTTKTVEFAARLETCDQLTHFIKKFNFQLQYAIL